MPKLNLELFKTLILNFANILSKRKKLGKSILFQKCQFVNPNKVNSSPIRSFPSFSIFGPVKCQRKRGSIQTKQQKRNNDRFRNTKKHPYFLEKHYDLQCYSFIPCVLVV